MEMGEPMDRPVPHEEEHSETSAARRELPPEGHRGALCAELWQVSVAGRSDRNGCPIASYPDTRSPVDVRALTLLSSPCVGKRVQ